MGRGAQHGTALSSVVDGLRVAGHEIIIQTVPAFAGDDSWTAIECTFFGVLNRSCTQKLPLQHALDRSTEVRSMVEEVAKPTGVEALELSSSVPWYHLPG